MLDIRNEMQEEGPSKTLAKLPDQNIDRMTLMHFDWLLSVLIDVWSHKWLKW